MLATSPLLEAFGNAQTVLNHNSSRYGKFLMLQFDLSGRIMGCTIQTYLLEKVRIVLPSYHPPPVRIVQQQRGEAALPSYPPCPRWCHLVITPLQVRIVQQQPGERGYHVLYYLAAAAPAALRAELQAP